MKNHATQPYRRVLQILGAVLCSLAAGGDSALAQDSPSAAALFERDRPEWEIRFADVSHDVMSVMPGESRKTYFDPLLKREILWEQDAYCPSFTLYKGKLYCIYRAMAEDSQWRFGLGCSEDGLKITRSEKPVLYGTPQDEFLGNLRTLGDASVSFEDGKLVAGDNGAFYLLFNYKAAKVSHIQQLAVATSPDLIHWKHHGRAFAAEAAEDLNVVPERQPWRLPHPAVVCRLAGDRFVAAKIDGKYWMYFNCLSTKGACCVCLATSENLLEWRVLRDEKGRLVEPIPLRPGRFDSQYIDTTAAVLRQDGILLIYNGVNARAEQGGDPRLGHLAHYPAQALFDRTHPARLLQRSTTPFKGGDPDLEQKPIVFWHAKLYESWSLAPWKGDLLLFWNHAFGRRSVGLWRAPIPDSIRNIPAVP